MSLVTLGLLHDQGLMVLHTFLDGPDVALVHYVL